MKKRFTRSIPALLVSLLLVSCSGGARVDGRLDGASAGKVFVKVLDGATLQTVDSAKVSAAGRYVCRVPVSEGQPEFAYVYFGDRRVASLIVRKGDRLTVSTDTLGTVLSLKGSDESTLLQEADSSFAAFSAHTQGLEGPAFTREYVKFYRESVAFVLKHARSLACVPVLLRKVGTEVPGAME